VKESSSETIIKFVEIRFVESFYGSNEYGMFALLTPIEDDKNYILMNSEGIVEGYTRSIWSKILS
jgi:hypothetical protein